MVSLAIVATMVATPAVASMETQPPPEPIPGGIQIPDGPLIHTFLPGPKELGFMGFDVEPSTIVDFKGFTAMAYLAGTATDGDGNSYDMVNDMRVYSGAFVAADGRTYHGTFAFI
jgi:hypothetical protein